MSQKDADVAVIGAGIMGLTAALRLQMAGRQVLLIDPDEPASGCSAGNAGYLSEGSIFPPITPSVLKKLPSLMLDAMSPLSVDPLYLPKLSPWIAAMLQGTRPSVMRATIAALASLNRRAIASYEPLLEAADARDMVEIGGSLVAYRSAAILEAGMANLPRIREEGIPVEALSPEAAMAMEPALERGLVGAIHFPGSGRCVDPQGLGRKFAAAIVARGGIIRPDKVRGIAPNADGGWRITTELRDLHARQVLVAAGRWSDALLKPLGHKVPLEGERGYHLMLPDPEVTVTRPIVLADYQICATPMTAGLRLAGTVEFTFDGAPMKPKRSDMMLAAGQAFFRGLSGTGATRWMGVRPSLPDGRPAIGRSSRHPGLFYCFGHQHIGMTQAAVSAELIAEIITDLRPQVDATPFSLDRFS